MSRRSLLLAFVAVVALYPLALHGDEPLTKASDPERVVLLNEGRDFTILFGKTTYLGLLGREIARQSLLIAAREELSCVTRDVHLGQAMPKTGGIEMDLLGVAGKTSRLVFMTGRQPLQEALAMEDLAIGDEVDLAALVPVFEKLSRGEFVSHLRAAGLKGEPCGWSENAKVSAEVSKLLQEMNFVSQWDAACRLHGEIARNGQSPTVMAALSMAYANLGILTEFHWAPAHDVFTARALLYAQRLVVSGRNPTIALSARAYAYTLAGLFPAALADLDEFAKLSPRDQEKARDKLPLTDLLRAYCRFSVEDLSPETYEPSLLELATLLRFLVHDFSKTNERRVEVGVEAINKMPHCYRIIASLSTDPGVGLGHMATGAANIATVMTIYPRIAAIESLPQEARAILKTLKPPSKKSREVDFQPAADFEGRAKLVAILAKSHEPLYAQEELTWPVLASQITEHSFGEIFLRARFVKYDLGLPVDDWLDDAHPMYQGHHYAALIETFRGDRQLADASVKKAMAIDLDTTEFQAVYLMWVNSSDPSLQTWRNYFNAIYSSRMDITVNDVSRLIPFYPNFEYYVNHLFQLCPEQPLAQKGIIDNNWPDIQKNMDEWMKRGEKNPDILIAISKKYEFERQFNKALAMVKRACDIQPNFVHFRALAGIYQKQEKVNEWQAALEESLKYPTSGLEHFVVKQEIADHFFQRRQWKEALPYSEGAAKCYSASGLLSAAMCHEALQNWDEAEQYYRAASERYDSTWWFSFTKRTGHGDKNAAALFTANLFKTPPQEFNSLGRNFYFTLFSGNNAAAAKLIEGNWAKDSQVLYNGLFYALLLDEQNKSAEGLAVLKEALHLLSQPDHSQKYVRSAAIRDLALLIVADLSAEGKAEFPPDSVEKARSRFQPGDNFSRFDYFVGRYYELHGKKDEAWRSYMRCMSYPSSMIEVYRTLAGMRLQELGEKPSVYREALLTGKIPENKGK